MKKHKDNLILIVGIAIVIGLYLISPYISRDAVKTLCDKSIECILGIGGLLFAITGITGKKVLNNEIELINLFIAATFVLLVSTIINSVWLASSTVLLHTQVSFVIMAASIIGFFLISLAISIKILKANAIQNKHKNSDNK